MTRILSWKCCCKPRGEDQHGKRSTPRGCLHPLRQCRALPSLPTSLWAGQSTSPATCPQRGSLATISQPQDCKDWGSAPFVAVNATNTNDIVISSFSWELGGQFVEPERRERRQMTPWGTARLRRGRGSPTPLRPQADRGRAPCGSGGPGLGDGAEARGTPAACCTREASLLRNGERTVFQRRSADPLIFYILGRHIQRPRLRITEGHRRRRAAGLGRRPRCVVRGG